MANKIGRFELDDIYCEDCYKALKDIPDKSIDLIMTDPPYLITNTKAGDKGKISLSIQNMNNELLQNRLTESMDVNLLNDFMRVMKKPNIYIWCNHKQIPMYLDYFVNFKKCNFDIIIWNKTNATALFNNKYLTDKEYCLYFRRGGYCKPSTYEEAKTVYCQPKNIKDKQKYNHPTIKPLNIIKTLIKNSSKPNEVILDCFAGSGTSLVASKDLGRHYIGFEINEKWYKVAKNRLNKIEVNGQTSLF